MSKLLAFILVAAFTSIAPAESLVWPQFRGPGGTGVAEDEKPPIELGPDKNVKWKVPVPSGLSSPIIVGDKLVITAFDDGKLFTIAYNRADGSEAWRAQAHAKELEPYHEIEGSPAASTPATDGKQIISYFGSCGLVSYDLSGNERWKLEMSPALTLGGFGTGVSPVMAEGLVVLQRDEANDPKIVVVDAATGDIKWEKKRASKSGYCTPAVWRTPQGVQIAAAGFGQMTGYDLKTGEEKWFVIGMPSAACASPVATDDDLFFAAWSPGDPSEKSDFKMPTFDELKKQVGDDDGDGALSKQEAEDSDLKSFFANQDHNKDGKITSQEWDSMLQFIGASRNSAFALKPGGTGDITATHMRWKQTRGLPYVPTAIVYDGMHVMVKDAVVTAYDAATGKRVFYKRALAPGTYYASPVAANGHIYFASLADGVITVLKAESDTLEVAAENPPLGERLAATPAIADDTLYVRTAGHLYAFAESK